MNEPRITPEEVVTAYQETGLKIVDVNAAVVKDGRVVAGCGIGAFGLHRGVWSVDELEDNSQYDPYVYGRLYEVYGYEYVDAWTGGFDSAYLDHEWDESLAVRQRREGESDRRYQGWHDGYVAAMKVLSGVPEVEVPDYPPVEEYAPV